MAHIVKLGPNRYRLRWIDPNGRERSKVHPRKADAERHLTDIEHSKRTGTYVDPAASKITVGVMAEQWYGSKIDVKPSTRARYRNVLDVHVIPRWGQTPLSRVQYSDITKWAAELHASGLAGGSVKKATAVLSMILTLAVRDRRLAVNPADGVKAPRSRPKPRRYLTAVQVSELAIEAALVPTGRSRRASVEAHTQYRLVILMLAYCGLRWSEVAALRVRSVDLLRRRLTIAEGVTEVDGSGLVWGTPKDHEARSVPLPAFLADELMVQLAGKAPDDLLFTAPDGGVLRNRNARRDWFDHAATAVGVTGLTPHELRHTAASLAVSAGANVLAVQRMLGHASAAMTLDTYSDLFDTDLDAVAERLDAVFRAHSASVTASRRHDLEPRDLAEIRQPALAQ